MEAVAQAIIFLATYCFQH